jgi:hypothetical protein
MPQSAAQPILNVQVDRAIHDALHAIAKHEDRSLSSVIRIALRDWLARRKQPHGRRAVPQPRAAA